MRVITDITRKDLVKFNLRFIASSRSTYKLFLFVVIGVFGYLCWSKGFPDSNLDWKATLIGSIAGGVIAVVFNFVTCIISILMMSKKSNGILGKHEYELTQEGLIEKTIANESINKWEGIESIKVAGSNILIQISGYLYHIFPLRFFNSQDDFDAFKKQADSLFDQAHNKPFKQDK
jgi:hypothetical protein